MITTPDPYRVPEDRSFTAISPAVLFFAESGTDATDLVEGYGCRQPTDGDKAGAPRAAIGDDDIEALAQGLRAPSSESLASGMTEPAISVLSAQVRPGNEDRFVRMFVELDIFGQARERAGLRRARLLRPVADGEPFVVVAEWDRPADYQRWLEDPAREDIQPWLEPIVEGAMTTALYSSAVSSGHWAG